MYLQPFKSEKEKLEKDDVETVLIGMFCQHEDV